LKFTQGSGNCITLNRAASLRGNHATIFVLNHKTSGFAGNVINVDTTVHTSVKDVPPFTHWDPQWKTGRYMTNLNICQVCESNGLNTSQTGEYFGRAINIFADETSTSTFTWGLDFNGIRIAGPFEYGIYAKSIGAAYNNDMHIEALIDSCKIGGYFEDCSTARLDIVVQPRKAENGTKYATQGIVLNKSKHVDLTRSRVWDWLATNTLWASGNANQHLALYGNCQGLVINDFLYYEGGVSEVRDLIYTDTPSNLEKLVILQEPFTRWFRSKDNVPYFYNGTFDKQLALQENVDTVEAKIDYYFDSDTVKGFTDVLESAGMTKGGYLNTDGVGITSNGSYSYTGFIPCTRGSTIYAKDLTFAIGDQNMRIMLYDANHTFIKHVNRDNIIANSAYYFVTGYEGTNDSFKITIANTGNTANVAYVRFNFRNDTIGNNPMMAINEEVKFIEEGFLSDTIKVKGSSVILTSANGKSFTLNVSNDGTLSTSPVVV
jgi:hypothetical protein